MLRIENLNKSFGGKKVLVDLNLEIERKSIVMIVGESGVGKTTLIRCLSGLESYDSGRISLIGEEDRENSIGMVFQNFNLFPNLSAMENISYALIKVKKLPRDLAMEKAGQLMDLLGLAGLEDHYEYQLSGGQRQRVAIARALAMEPAYLCFDEPTSALDYKLRDSVGAILRTVAESGTGLIVITHDREFAEKYGDRIYDFDKKN